MQIASLSSCATFTYVSADNKGGTNALILTIHTVWACISILSALGSVHRSDVGGANCCHQLKDADSQPE